MGAREMIVKLRGRADSLYTYFLQRVYFRLFGHQVGQRFAIVGNARTGSNFLLGGLKSSPSIRMYHEIFASHNRKVGENFDKILSTVYQYESKPTRMVGFKIFYNHLTEEEWKKLVAHKDLKIIHLTRRNRLRTVISLEIAFKTGQWTRSGNAGSQEEKHITLDPRKLLQRLQQIEEGEFMTRSRFCDRQILEVVYEELVDSPHDVFASVAAYLGVNGIDPDKIRLKKQNPESLQQLIVNYNEVEAVLKNTPYAAYLDD